MCCILHHTEYSALRNGGLRWAQAYIVMFALNSQESFDFIPSEFELFQHVKDRDISEIPVVIVGYVI